MLTLPQSYARMRLIRAFEEKALELFALGELHGTTHTYLGQEANAVGILQHVQTGDAVVSNHRCHGHYLALFDDPAGLMAELMGKASGVCAGVGGSQHLHREHFYTNGVQGGIVPMAAGISLALKKSSHTGIAVVFIGDGTLGEGVVYETLNLAALWRLPLLCVVEDNRYAQSTPTHLQIAGSMIDRGRAFGIAVAETDSTDATVIAGQAQSIVQQVRETQTPFWWVIHTYRFGPHSKGDDYRDPQEIAGFRQHDPLEIIGQRLPPVERASLDAHSVARLQAALETARQAPPAGALDLPESGD